MAEVVGLIERLRVLCEPAADSMADDVRVAEFVKVGLACSTLFSQFIEAAIGLENESNRLLSQCADLAELHRMATDEYERDVVDLRKRVRLLKRFEQEATEHIERQLRARTGFTGEFPYHGWQGVGKAIGEIIDQRQIFKAALEEIFEYPNDAKALAFTALRINKH